MFHNLSFSIILALISVQFQHSNGFSSFIQTPEGSEISAENIFQQQDSSKSSQIKHRERRDTLDDEEEVLERIRAEEEKTRLKKKQTQQSDRNDNDEVGNGNSVTEIKRPPAYSIYEIPKDEVHGGPINVHVKFDVIKILDFDETNQIIKLDLEFHVLWIDYKIMYHNNPSLRNASSQFTVDDLNVDEIANKTVTLNNPNILDKIWKPNLFILNLISVRQAIIMSKPLTIKFIPEYGWFKYITRISVYLDCEMDFHYYPADTQICDISIRGFSYNKDHLRLHWYKTGAFLHELSIPNFDAKIDSLRHHDFVKKDPVEIFDVLSFQIIARRQLQYHLVQTYIASTFYIVITCLCFLLPSKMVEARIGITMTTLLTLTAMFASVRESTPIVSYVKAIDTWMFGCICFVFLTLSQFTCYIWLNNIKQEFQAHQEKLRNARRSTKTGEIEISMEEWTKICNPSSPKNPPAISMYDSNQFDEEKVWKYDKLARAMESFSFIIFMAIFLAYTILYWSWLLVRSEYFTWNVNSTWNQVEDE